MSRPPGQVLAELVRNRGRHLTRYGFLLTGDPVAAQDLVQDALVKVFARSRDGFTPDTAEAYVRRTMLTLYVDGYRRQRHWHRLRHLVAVPDEGYGPELATAARVDLHRALATLSPQERACVVLRFFEDLTVPEIADQMNLASGTVKRYLSNAVGKLGTVLGPVAPPEDRVPVVPLPSAAATRRRPTTSRSGS